MTEQLTQTSAASPPRAKLACRLRKRTTGRLAQSPLSGEVELENTSGEVLEIEIRMSRLEHLNLIVADAGGRVLSEGHYGDIFSPMEKLYLWRLQPGEKFVHPAPLSGLVPREKMLPGEYTVQAVYEYNGLRAVSEPFHFQVKGESP